MTMTDGLMLELKLQFLRLAFDSALPLNAGKMERPGSRSGMSGSGMKAPTGSSVPMPDRPGSAANRGGILGTAAGRPPGTASRGPVMGGLGQPPPGTAYKRLGTANQRPGTGQQQGPGGARLGTAVQVENRPITNHGVSGIRQGGGGGGGRRVLDKNFFLTELRQKRSEIASVTRNMEASGTGVGWGAVGVDGGRAGVSAGGGEG
eukprot:gene11194-18811_t